MIVLYVEDCRRRQLRPKTMLSYEQALKLFAAWLKESEGVLQVEKIEEKHISRYVLELQTRGKYTFCPMGEAVNYPQNRRDYKKPVSSITINNYLRNLRAFFNWLVEMECIPHSPMKRNRMLSEERKPREYMEDDEVKALLKSLDRSYFSEYRDLLVIMLMLDSGTRLGETLSIEVDQLDIVDRSLYLPASKTKGRKSRTVFFSPKTAKELRRWLQFKDRYCHSELLFPVKHSGQTLQLNDFEANFRKYLKRIGSTKRISPHTLRNNFAKRCLLAGMDIYTLSRLLGHSSVSVTEKAYLDVKDHDLRSRYSRFSPIAGIYDR